MKSEMYSAELIFNLNERLFLNALAGVSEEQANERLSNHNNPYIWIATHTVWARYNTAALAGRPAENPYAGMFENFKPFEENMAFPTIEEVTNEWKKASALLRDQKPNR